MLLLGEYGLYRFKLSGATLASPRYFESNSQAAIFILYSSTNGLLSYTATDYYSVIFSSIVTSELYFVMVITSWQVTMLATSIARENSYEAVS